MRKLILTKECFDKLYDIIERYLKSAEFNSDCDLDLADLYDFLGNPIANKKIIIEIKGKEENNK